MHLIDKIQEYCYVASKLTQDNTIYLFTFFEVNFFNFNLQIKHIPKTVAAMT